MCEVNVAKFNPKPHFGDVKVGDMFQDMSDYWYMKVKIKDGRECRFSAPCGHMQFSF